jgi:hypothetical protein
VGIGAHGLPHDEKPGLSRALTTTEFERYQKTGRLPIDAVPLDIGIVPGMFKAPTGIARLEAAALEHQYMSGVGQTLEQTAGKYGIKPKMLAKHIRDKGQQLDDRVHGNRETWHRRSVKHNELDTQFPASRSAVTLAIQKRIDKVSEFIGPRAEALKASESLPARALGRSVEHAGAGMRSMKQQGNLTRQKIVRGHSKRALDVSNIKDVGHGLIPMTKDEGAVAAHWMYAQLPTEWRNVQGLERWRARLVEEHDAELAKEHPNLDVVQTQADTLGKLDHLIKHPVEADQTAIDSMSNLDQWMTGEKIKSGLLTPEDAQARRGIITRWIEGTDTARTPEGKLMERTPGEGNYYTLERDVTQAETVLRGEQRRLTTLERRSARREASAKISGKKLRTAPSLEARVASARASVERWQKELDDAKARREQQGPKLKPLRDRGEIFVGHRESRVRGGGGMAGASLGKTLKPAGVGNQNTLALVRTGRVHMSLDKFLQDVEATSTYAQHNATKEIFWKAGTKPTSLQEIRQKVGSGEYVLINPHGEKIPRAARTSPEAQATSEGFHDPMKVLATDSEEYVRNYMAADPADAERILAHAQEHGYLDDLRLLQSDYASKYFGRFLTPKMRAEIPGLAQTGLKALGKGAGLVNDAVHFGLIYANPGYIPANSVQNLIMAMAHQGPLVLSNYPRAVQLLLHGPKHVKNLVLGEVGMGGTKALGTAINPMRSWASAVGNIADSPARVSAFLHEMGREGVIDKFKPFLDDEDYKAIQDFIENPANESKLNDARDAAVQSEVDFERLGPNERLVLTKLGFVYTWLRAGSRYPFRFAADHPFRSMLIAYVLEGAPGAPPEVQKKIHDLLPNVATGMPPWLAGALEAGTTVVDKIPYPQVLPTRQISPISTPHEIWDTIRNNPGANSVGEMLNPALTTAWFTAHQQNRFGSDVGSYGKSVEANAMDMFPGIALTKDLVHPPAPGDAGLYPEDVTRIGRLKRALRVFPIAIDPKEAYASRKRLGMEGDLYATRKHELIQRSKETGLGVPPDSVFVDMQWATKLDQDLHKHAEDNHGKLDYVKAVRIAAKLVDERFGGNTAHFYTGNIDEPSAHHDYLLFRHQLNHDYNKWETDIQKEEDARVGG